MYMKLSLGTSTIFKKAQFRGGAVNDDRLPGRGI